MTQRSLALAVGVEEQTVRKWEKGERIPRLESLARLSVLLEKTPEELGFPPQEKLLSQEALPEEVLQQKHHRLSALVPEEKDQNIPSRQSKRDDNRQRMLQRVRSRWITGILEHSLYQRTLITLGLQERPDAVDNPWRLTMQESNLPPRLLPPGTRITDIYDETGGELLILGEPGSGKTTLLLELARDLLERAQCNDQHLMPVIFNLSSWAEKRQPLEHWLIEELNTKYHVPFSLGQVWIETHQMILLLDGLDEVAEAYRSACMEAINRYHQKYGIVPLVVCSRSSDYFAQSGRLLLGTAVVVQPLTLPQIDAYLSHSGEELAEVRAALHKDQTLQEFVATPLMLNMLVLTSHEQADEVLLAEHSLTDRRHLLFKHYVKYVLERRGAHPRYSGSQTIHWLGWLARYMQQHSQAEFYVERLQPTCFPDEHLRQQYRNMVIRFVFGVEGLIGAALFACFRGDSVPSQPGLFYWLGGGRGNSLLGWMSPGLGSFQGSGSLGIIFIFLQYLLVLLLERRTIPTLSMKSMRQALISGVRDGLIFGVVTGGLSSLILSVGTTLANGIYRGVGLGLFAGLITGVMSGLIIIVQFDQPDPPQPRWIPLSSSRILNGLCFGGCASIGFCLIFAAQAGGLGRLAIEDGIIIGIFNWILYLGTGLEFKLIRELGMIDIIPAEIVSWSWKNVGRHLPANLRKGSQLGGVIMVCVMIILTCASSSFYGVVYGVRYGVVFGFIVGLIGGIASIVTGVLTDGWSSNRLEEHQLLRPNEGIQRSVRNAVWAASLFGPLGGLTAGLVSEFAFQLAGIAGWKILGTGLMIVIGIAFALQVWAFYGGIASLEHYLLRYTLWRLGNMPWNYIAFLDYAAERILLQKVGGGYIFIHRLLLDYFAHEFSRQTTFLSPKNTLQGR